jgi:hypothetical protein
MVVGLCNHSRTAVGGEEVRRGSVWGSEEDGWDGEWGSGGGLSKGDTGVGFSVSIIGGCGGEGVGRRRGDGRRRRKGFNF